MVDALWVGEIYTPLRRLENALIQFENGKVSAIRPKGNEAKPAARDYLDAGDAIAIPGLVDLQVNGALGWSFQAEHREHADQILDYHLRHGTTSLLPTLVTAPEAVLLESLAVLAKLTSQEAAMRPYLPGIHLEGPFLSPEKSGAHDQSSLRMPDLPLAQRFEKASRGKMRIFTLAPELAGAEDVIRYLSSRGLIVSAGHSAARFDEMEKAAAAGLSMVTHAGNASDWPHRALGDLGFLTSEPGVVGALIADDRLAGGVILDGFHFHPALLKPLLRLKGSDGLSLVSDASTVAGCPPGDYNSGGLEVTVHPQGFATSGRGGGWLAGSTITLLQAVQHAVNLSKITLQQAVLMATLAPARQIGIEATKGQIEVGADADLLVLNRDLSLRMVIIGGRVVDPS